MTYHNITGTYRFLNHNLVKDKFTIDSLNEKQKTELDTFFNNTRKTFKQWHWHLLIKMVEFNCVNLTQQFTRLRQITKHTKEYYQILYGDTIGELNYKNHCNQARETLGIPETMPKELILQICRERSKKGSIGATKKLKGTSDYSIRSIKYWLLAGLTEPEAKQKVKEIQSTNSKKYYQKKYGDNWQTQFNNRNQNWSSRIKEIMLEKGLWKCDTEFDSIQKYKKDVTRFTNQNYKKHLHILNPNNLPRDGKQYELDHLFSIHQGYLENIPAKIIGSYINLKLIPAYENASKWVGCSITKEDLLEKYQQTLPGNPINT